MYKHQNIACYDVISHKELLKLAQAVQREGQGRCENNISDRKEEREEITALGQ